MILYLNVFPPQLYSDVHELIRLAYPDSDITLDNSSDWNIEVAIRREIRGDSISLNGYVDNLNDRTVHSNTYGLTEAESDTPIQTRRVLCRFVYHLLCRHLQRDFNAYGILSGVRPVKLVHKMMDMGLTGDQIIDQLQAEYLVQAEKARLLQEIAGNNRYLLSPPDRVKRVINLYIGIPYCPTRCYYCSFPGAILTNYEQNMTPFMQALLQEMEAVGRYISDCHMAVQSIYIGGGTPTVLSEADMNKIFDILQLRFISAHTAEITVEAGRPDTINPGNLKLFKSMGVNRVCVNPQTMNNSTLQSIGRNHNEKGVVQAVEWVREAGIEQINMDLIVGLPGEGLRENTYTAERILQLKPENVTVHTLAVKKGSALAEREGKSGVRDRVPEVAGAIALFSGLLKDEKYLPYYLYRQKYMKANLENIGYSLPDNFCLYNIQVMEERQTIIGLGGGASSKFVNQDLTLSSFYNPKDPQSYCASVDRLISRKVDKLMALN